MRCRLAEPAGARQARPWLQRSPVCRHLGDARGRRCADTQSPAGRRRHPEQPRTARRRARGPGAGARRRAAGLGAGAKQALSGPAVDVCTPGRADRPTARDAATRGPATGHRSAAPRAETGHHPGAAADRQHGPDRAADRAGRAAADHRTEPVRECEVTMAVTLTDKLVVAISSRALFDFEAENRVFERGNDRAYVALQRQRIDEPAAPGVAFSLVRKLLAFNSAGCQRVEVVLLSRNDPVSGLRGFRSCNAHGLPAVQRGVFTQGRDPFRYLRPLGAHLFLSANEADVRQALHLGYPAARVVTESVQAGDANPLEVRIAFDGDAVLFSDEAERVYQDLGLAAFQQHETDKATLPLPDGPFKPLLAALHRLQSAGKMG